MENRNKKNEKEIILGVDSGGTKTKSILVDPKLELLSIGYGGPGNYHNIGIEKSKQNIKNTIKEAVTKADIKKENIKHGGFGIGGLDTETDRKKITNFLETIKLVKNLEKKHIANDVIISLYSITGGRPGIVVVAGTGSITYGTNEKGEDYRVGGWGWPIGDEGSGTDIARRGLQAAAKAYDGRGDETKLTELAKREFELENFDELIPKLDVLDFPSGISSFAESVINAGAEGDGKALEIVNEAGEELAESVLAVKRKLSMEEPVRVGCVGGLTSSELFFNKFKEKVTEKVPNVEILDSVQNPVVGAVALVLENLGKRAPIDNLRTLDSMIAKRENKNGTNSESQ